jgi:LacI family transcriptional regulator
MLKIFEEKLKKLEYSFLVHAVAEDQDEAEVAIELAKEKRLKGIIFLGGIMDSPEKRLKRIHIPYVLCTVAVNMNMPKRECSSVSIDDEKESYCVVDYLCKKGHEKIAIVTGRKTDYAVGGLRLQGYKKALRDNGIAYDKELVCYMRDDIPEYSAANGYAVTRDLINSGVPFTALYAISDLVAFGAYKAILEAGKRIPEDYSVIGFDGLELTKYFHPSLTTVEQPCEEMVQHSIQALMEAINGDTEHKRLIFEAKLLERDSVAVLKTGRKEGSALSM